VYVDAGQARAHSGNRVQFTAIVDAAETPSMLFAIGDYLAGIAVGILTTFAVRFFVAPGLDMVVAMVIGMAVGMIVHIVVGFLLGFVLGMFETMMPGSLIGMYGGMLFGMRDSMGAGSTTPLSAALVGGGFGVIVVCAVRTYDRILRGTVLDTGE
jgi:hypothetical protein